MGVFDHFMTTTLSTTTTTPSKTTTPSGDKGTPWWVWLIVALVIALGAAAMFASSK